MKVENKKLLGMVSALALFAGAGWALAEDPPAGDAVNEAAAVPAEGGEPVAGGEAPAAPVVPVKPRPSELAPLAPKSLMLDVTSSGKVLVAVGDRGQIIVSKDGKKWAQVLTPVRAPLTAVTFVDENNGWAVGHDAVILHTADGGRTWMLQNFQPELEKPFLDVLFLDAQNGFAVGAYGLFKKTSDGGKTWTDVDAPSIRADEVHFNSIIKLGDGSLFIAGEAGMLGVSSDGGNTWEKLTSPYDASLFGALPVGEKGAAIFGLRGNAYITQDVKSNRWTKIETNTVSSFFGGSLLPNGELAMVGLNGLLMITDANGGNVHTVTVKYPEEDKDGKVQMKDLSSTLSAAIPFGSGMVLVGEKGVQNLDSVQ